MANSLFDLRDRTLVYPATHIVAFRMILSRQGRAAPAGRGSNNDPYDQLFALVEHRRVFGQPEQFYRFIQHRPGLLRLSGTGELTAFGD